MGEKQFELYPDGFIKSPVKLTVSLLLSNRIQYAERVFEGLKPLLEGVKSELIVIDTVGPENSDGSLEIAKRYTDKIYHFDWVRDFAKARNVGIDAAQGEWFMFLDDDEVFEDVSDIIEFLNSPKEKKYNSAKYEIHNLLGDGAIRVVNNLRMVRRKPNTRFEGRIHECFNEAHVPVYVSKSYVKHYGYCFVNTDDVRAHQKRNISLLEEEIKEEGTNARLCAQLVQERIFTDGTEEEGYNDAVKFLSELPESELNESAGQWIIAATIRHFRDINDNERVLTEVENVKKKYSLSQTCRMVIDYCAACAAATLNDADACLLYAKEYLAMRHLLKTNPNDTIMQAFLDTDLHMDDTHYANILEFMIYALAMKEQYDEAYNYAKKYYEQTGEFDGIKFKVVMTKILSNMKDKKAVREFYSHIYTEEGMKVVFG